jgi:tetratricopeptide (TPR) repeat protein
MSGGKRDSARRKCARQLASSLLGGLLVAPWAAGVDSLRADEAADPAPVVADEAADVDEKSIVVESGKLPEDEGFFVASDQDDALQPIAVPSEDAPDLADPPPGDPASTPEPTLAEEYVAVVDEGESSEEDEPSADDAALDEELAKSDEAPAPTIQVASFNGATPGVTTRAEVLRDWGQPAADAGTALVYELEGFPSVAISLKGDVVETIRVELAGPADAALLTEKLGLSDVRPAVLFDEIGAVATCFPERGVTYNHRQSDAAATDGAAQDSNVEAQVYEIVIRPIEAGPFVLRAETAAARDYSRMIADLETALRLDPKDARVRWLLSQVKLSTGSAVGAEALAREAVDLAPRTDAYRLQWAKCLKYLARYQQAVEQTRLVLEGATATQLERAAALEQMGLLAALGSHEVQERAVPLHNKAIALADSLSTSEDPVVAIEATQLLVSAHLAVADRIAAGDWQDKDKFVAQWISRASALAEQMIESGEADVSLRLQVAVGALAAGARLQPPIDPKLWVEEAEQAAAELRESSGDVLASDELNWQLGMAYCYAAEISHRRSETEPALQYGAMAAAALEPAVLTRQEMPDANFVLGRLYFQIGAVHAVHRDDHETACQWYDQAIEPLSAPVPVTALASPGQHSDALVSMAVSYWETGDRERAYELTGAGVELVEQAIAEGLLAANALEVPQGNFLAMSRALGKVELATPAGATAEATAEATADASTPPAQVTQAPPSTNKRTVRGSTGRSQSRMATRPGGSARRR